MDGLTVEISAFGVLPFEGENQNLKDSENSFWQIDKNYTSSTTAESLRGFE